MPKTKTSDRNSKETIDPISMRIINIILAYFDHQYFFVIGNIYRKNAYINRTIQPHTSPLGSPLI